MATLQIREGHDTGRVFTLDEEVYLGRCPEGIDPRRFLPLPDGEVSRRHARISRTQTGYQIEDLGSTNGTQVGNEALPPKQPRPLKDGDEIRISSTLLVFREYESSAMIDTGRPPLGAPAGGGVFSRHPRPGRSHLRLNDKGLGEMSVMLDASQSILQKFEADKREDVTLVKALRRLQAMTQVSIALGAVDDREQLMQKIMDNIFDIFPGAEGAFVLLKDRETEELVPVAQMDRSSGAAGGEDIALSRTIIDQVVANRQAILSVDVQGDQRLRHRSRYAISRCRASCVRLCW
ncbi:MAG: hypothetical protein Kow006_31860 [Gammaproteobacteria bacterium]